MHKKIEKERTKMICVFVYRNQRKVLEQVKTMTNIKMGMVQHIESHSLKENINFQKKEIDVCVMHEKSNNGT